MSFTNIEYVDSVQRWEMSVKLFKDDFGEELKQLYGWDIGIEDSLVNDEEAVFKKYLSEFFVLQFDNNTISADNWRFEGKRINYEAVWLNFSFFSDEPKKIRIKNKLMFSLFQDQKNLLIFTYQGKQKAFQFRQNKADIEFEID